MADRLGSFGRPFAAAKQENNLLRPWSTGVVISFIISFVTGIFGFRDVSMLAALAGVVGLLSIPFIHYPLPTAGAGLILLVTKPNLVISIVGSCVAALVYIWNVPVQNNLSLAVSVLAAFFALVVFALLPKKSGLIIAFIFLALGFIIWGTSSLLSGTEMNLGRLWQVHPRPLFYVALIPFYIIIRNWRVSVLLDKLQRIEKDAQKEAKERDHAYLEAASDDPVEYERRKKGLKKWQGATAPYPKSPFPEKYSGTQWQKIKKSKVSDVKFRVFLLCVLVVAFAEWQLF